MSKKSHCRWMTDKKLVRCVSSHLEPVSLANVKEIKKFYREFKYRLDKNNEDLKRIKVELDKFKNKSPTANSPLVEKETQDKDILLQIFDEISIEDDSDYDDVLEDTEKSNVPDEPKFERPAIKRALGRRQLINLAPESISISEKNPPAQLKRTKAMRWDNQGLNVKNSKKRLYFAGFAKIAAEEIKKFKNITEDNIQEILALLLRGNNGDSWKEQLESYGPKILDGDFLINLIKGMEDEAKKRKAIKSFIKWQLTALAHKFSLGGSMIVQNASTKFQAIKPCHTTVQLEGWWQHFTHAKILSSLERFFEKNPIANQLNQEYRAQIIEALKLSCRLTEKASKKDIQEYVENHHAGKLGTIPTGWKGHAVGITTSENLIAYSNQGQSSEGWVSGTWFGIIGKTEKIDAQLVEKMIGKSNDSPKKRMEYFEGGLTNKKPPEKSIVTELNLRKFFKIDKKDQSVGNCSWVSAQDELQALIIFAFIQQMRQEFLQKLKSGNLNELQKNFSFAEMYKGIKNTYKDGIEAFEALPERERFDIVKQRCLSEFFEDDQKTIKSYTLFFSEVLHKAKAYYRSWNVFDAAIEMDHLHCLVKDLNKDNVYLTRRSQFKLISEVSRKFAQSDKMQKLHNKDKEAAEALFSKLNELIELKNYKLDDCIVSFEKFKNTIDINFVNKFINGKVDGSFMLYKNNNFAQSGRIFIAYRFNQKNHMGFIDCKNGPNGKLEYSVTINGQIHVLDSLLDLNAHLPTILKLKDAAEQKLSLKYPIYDQKLIERYRTNNFAKD